MKKSEYRKIIRGYFGNSLKRLSIIMEGDIICLDIVYQDFHPKNIVHRDIAELIPMSDVFSLERIYSDNAIGNMAYYNNRKVMQEIESKLYLMEL